MIVCRNSAPVAPSTARWSHVSVIVIIGRTCRSPSTRHDLVARRADGEDRRLRRVEHGDELVDVVHAEVRDRERAALEILARAACRRARGRRGRRAPARSARSSAARRRARPARRAPAARRRRCRRSALGKTSSASSVYCTFMSRCRISACAQTLRQQVGDGDAHVGVRARAAARRARSRASCRRRR